MVELWVEGFRTQGGGIVGARRLGFYEGPDYANAVMQFLDSDWDRRNQGEIDFASGKFRLFGCRIFDNELEAKESFG